jgi:glutathione S-transferase
MRLYSATRAPNGRRTEMFLIEKGIDLPITRLDLAKHEHRGEAFKALNPLQRIPVLELDDGTVITESIAICHYFEALQPEPALFGRTPAEKGLVEMWNRRLELEFYLAVQHAFRHLHPGMAGYQVPQIAPWGELNKARALEFLALLDGQLAKGPFVCGDAFTVADITGFVALEFCKPARIAVPEQFGAVKRWHAAISARPSASVA